MAYTIQSFLVDLGFKLDRQGLSLFSNTLKTTRAEFVAFSTAVTAAVVTIEETIRRVRNSFENLFYLSQRTLTSARNIEALRAAFEHIGLSSGEADSALTQLATKFRENPAYRFIFGQITGTNDPAEGLKRIFEQHKRIIDQFGEISPQAAANLQRLQAYFGLDPNLVTQGAKNIAEVRRAFARFVELSKQFGIDQDQAANRAKELGRSMEDVWNITRLAIQKITEQTFPALNAAFKSFSEWLKSPEFSGTLDNISAIINEVANKFTQWITSPQAADDMKNFLVGLRDVLQSTKTIITDIIGVTKELVKIIQQIQDSSFTAGEKTREFFRETNKNLEEHKTEPKYRFYPDLPQKPETLEESLRRSRELQEQRQRRYQFDPKTGRPRDIMPNEGYAPIPPLLQPQSYTGGARFQRIAYNQEFSITDLMRGFTNWWRGDSSFRPLIAFSDEVYTKLTDIFRDLFGLSPTNSTFEPSTGRVIPGRRPPGALGGMGGMSRESGARITGGGKVPRGTGFTYGMLKKLAMDVGFEGEDASIMAAIAMAESSGNPYAKKVDSVEASYGLTQINARAHKGGEQAYGDPVYAMKKAFELYQNRRSRGQRGFEDWSVYKNNMYRQHLGGAQRATPQDYPTSEQLKKPERSPLPPGVKLNSKDEPYSTTLETMSKRERENVEKAMKFIEENSLKGDPAGLGHSDIKPYYPNVTPLGSITNTDASRNIDATHNTNIVIHGSDARDIARQTEDVQRRQYAMHIRNLRTQLA